MSYRGSLQLRSLFSLLIRDRFQPVLDRWRRLKTSSRIVYWLDPDIPESLGLALDSSVSDSMAARSSQLRQPSVFRREFSRMPLTKLAGTLPWPGHQGLMFPEWYPPQGWGGSLPHSCLTLALVL